MQPGRAEEDAGRDLADYERKPEAACQLPKEPGHAKQEGEREEKDESVVAVHVVTGRGARSGARYRPAERIGGIQRYPRAPATASQRDWVNSSVPAVPPRSAVRIPFANVARRPASILLAAARSPM